VSFLRNGNFRARVFDAATRRACVEGVIPHGLRHTAASLAVQAGATVVLVVGVVAELVPEGPNPRQPGRPPIRFGLHTLIRPIYEPFRLRAGGENYYRNSRRQ